MFVVHWCSSPLASRLGVMVLVPAIRGVRRGGTGLLLPRRRILWNIPRRSVGFPDPRAKEWPMTSLLICDMLVP